MKTSILILALLQSIALTAFAQSAKAPGGDGDVSPVGIEATTTLSTKSRAQVKSEAKSAVQTGAMSGGDNPVEIARPRSDALSTKSRNEVKAETVAAAQTGDLKQGDGLESTKPSAMRHRKMMKKHMRKARKMQPDMAEMPVKN